MALSDVPTGISPALPADQAARETIAGLAPSPVREYLTWIDGAKRALTRARRIDGMLLPLKGINTKLGDGEG